jgi:hypothetical protein
MPVLNETPVYDDHQELQCLDSPSSVANDNAEGTARVFEIPKPVGWRRDAVILAASSMIAAVFTLFLLFVTAG